MITTDQEFMDAILKLNLNVWTLPELTFKFSQDTDCTVNIQIFENGNDKFQNDKGIKFFIMFDSISREAFMSIFNGARSWTLGKTDIWGLEELNSDIGRLISTNYVSMQKAFSNADSDGSLDSFLNEERIKHYYHLQDTELPNIKVLYLVPKEYFLVAEEFNTRNVPDYKIFEEYAIKFLTGHSCIIDMSKFNNFNMFMAVRGYAISQMFSVYTTVSGHTDDDVKKLLAE
jgi:hypothetical protein